MIDYKTILRLHSEKFSLRQIAARVSNSHHTVKKVIDTAAKSGVIMTLGEDVTNQELKSFFFRTEWSVKMLFMLNLIIRTFTKSFQKRALHSHFSGMSIVNAAVQMARSRT